MVTDTSSKLYQTCKQYVQAIKWQEIINKKDAQIMEDVSKIKNSEMFKLMQHFAELGDKYHVRLHKQAATKIEIEHEDTNTAEKQALLV